MLPIWSHAACFGAVQAGFRSACRVGPRTSVDDADNLRLALLSRLQRRWGMDAIRVNAQLLLDRLAYVGRGGLSDEEQEKLHLMKIPKIQVKHIKI